MITEQMVDAANKCLREMAEVWARGFSGLPDGDTVAEFLCNDVAPNITEALEAATALSQAEGAQDERALFEEWADKDSRHLDPEEYEKPTPDNNLYYRVQSTNDAYIGWCARAALPTRPREQEGAQVDAGTVERIRDAIAETLGEAYDCTRVWSAWHYGTMSERDFVQVAEQQDRLDELTQAVVKALPTHPRQQDGLVGYRHFYPGPYGGWRFNEGQEVNGGRPTKSEPLYAHPLPAASFQAGAEAMREAAAMVAHDDHASWYLSEDELTEYGIDSRRRCTRIAAAIRSLPIPASSEGR